MNKGNNMKSTTAHEDQFAPDPTSAEEEAWREIEKRQRAPVAAQAQPTAKESLTTEQLRADFAEWLRRIDCPVDIGSLDGEKMRLMFQAYQAGRAAMQSQPTHPEISLGLLEKIVDEVFDGAIEDASVIEDIYRVIAHEFALQSQDREDAGRIDFIEANPGWLRVSRLGHRTKQMWACVSPFTNYEYDLFKTAREAIDHARRVEGDGE